MFVIESYFEWRPFSVTDSFKWFIMLFECFQYIYFLKKSWVLYSWKTPLGRPPIERIYDTTIRTCVFSICARTIRIKSELVLFDWNFNSIFFGKKIHKRWKFQVIVFIIIKVMEFEIFKYYFSGQTFSLTGVFQI